MSFFDFGTGQLHGHHNIDRRKDDRAAVAVKLKAKLKELRDAGVRIEFEDDVRADETMNMEPDNHAI